MIKKFSFLASLGMGKAKTPTPEEKKGNKFYVGNVSDSIINRKKLLGSIK
jgi:hypothetical protein